MASRPCYRGLQQYSRVQPDLQLDDGLSPHLQVPQTTQQMLAQLVATATELHTEAGGEEYLV